MHSFSHSNRHQRRLKQVLTYLYLILLAIIIIYPLLITITGAFVAGNATAFTLNFHVHWTLDNFRRLFTETPYLNWYKNTLIVALATMITQVAVVTLTGYAYSRYHFVGRKTSLVFFLVLQMVPTMAALTAFFVMAQMVGAINHFWFLALIYIGGGIPMNTWLMKGYFDTVSYDLDESAKLDGAGHLRIFWQIVLPLVKPMVAVQALWAFMGPFSDYLLSKFLLRDINVYTVAPGLQTFIADKRDPKVALFAAGAILIAVPISALFFYLQKYFVSGLTAGGTKG